MKRIVVAEDNLEILKLVESTLKFRGYEVLATHDGQEAWETIQREIPDAAILDMNMPGVDGLEVCRRVRADPTTQHVGIIFLTAYEQLENKVAAFNAGADDYVVKPFVPGELALRIEAILKRGEAARAATPRPVVPSTVFHHNEIVGMLGSKGGVGTSVLAVNLAVSLAMSGAHTALVDLDLDHALANMLLNITPTTRQLSISDLSASYSSELDWEMVHGFMLHHSSGLELLPGPLSPTQAELVTGDHVKAYLQVLKDQFDYVIVDIATGFRDSNLDTFDLCDRLLIVVNPDVLSLKVYRAALLVLDQLQVTRKKISVVLNQPYPFSKVSMSDAKKLVELPVVATIPFGGEPFAESINSGAPIVQRLPQHPVSQAIKEFSSVLHTPAAVATARRGR